MITLFTIGFTKKSAEHFFELLKKYQDNRNGVSNDKFSKEEIDRLKELQNEPLTEYQKKALMINSSKDAIRSQIDQNDLKAMNKTMSINNAKLEQLKSQDMLKAGDAADSIIEAADKDIFGMLVNEGKQNIDDNMKEQQEEAKKAEEEKEKKQEQIDEAKKKRQEEKELLENEQQADKLELDNSINSQAVDHLSEAQQQVEQLMKNNNMVNEDIKGIEIDLNF